MALLIIGTQLCRFLEDGLLPIQESISESASPADRRPAQLAPLGLDEGGEINATPVTLLASSEMPRRALSVSAGLARPLTVTCPPKTRPLDVRVLQCVTCPPKLDRF